MALAVHHYERGGDDFYEPLRNVYLYDLIVSIFAIAGGLLICLYVVISQSYPCSSEQMKLAFYHVL